MATDIGVFTIRANETVTMNVHQNRFVGFAAGVLLVFQATFSLRLLIAVVDVYRVLGYRRILQAFLLERFACNCMITTSVQRLHC